MRDDLRDEIRTAFAREQAAHPPGADLRSTIARSATSQSVGRPNLQWVAVLAALVITALVIASLVSSRVSALHGAPARHNVTGDYGPPPAGVPLVYLADTQHPGWEVGFDWMGRPRGTIKLPKALDSLTNLFQSPDGSLFVTTIGAKGGGGEFYDRLGKPLGAGPQFPQAMWADDNRHMCGMSADTSAGWWDLATIQPGEEARMVAPIVPYAANAPAGVSVIACSFISDQAVVAKDAYSGPTELWVYRLSTGKELIHQSLPPMGSIGTVVASSDGKLVAENSSQSVGFPGGKKAEHTYVVRPANGWVDAALDPAWAVLAFGPDNLTMLVTTSIWYSGFPTHLAVVDLNGRILWQNDGTEELATYFAEPTQGFVIVLKTPKAAFSHPPVDVVLVTAGGVETRLASGYQRP